jgi:hypothetical protein
MNKFNELYESIMNEGTGEGIWPQSNLSAVFAMHLNNALNKRGMASMHAKNINGKEWLMFADTKVLEIDPSKDSIDKIMKKLDKMAAKGKKIRLGEGTLGIDHRPVEEYEIMQIWGWLNDLQNSMSPIEFKTVTDRFAHYDIHGLDNVGGPIPDASFVDTLSTMSPVKFEEFKAQVMKDTEDGEI